MNQKNIIVIFLLLVLIGCASVDITKTAKGFYDPTNPNDVEILKTRPDKPYEELGTITAVHFRALDTATMHNAIRAKSAPLGATAVILTQEGIYDDQNRWAMGVAIRYNSASSSNTTSYSKAPIVALTVAKKNTSIKALVVKQENIQKDNVKLSDRWEKVGSTLNGLQLFIDNNTKSKPSEDIVRVWVKTIATTDNSTDLLEIDCVQLKIKKIDSQKESIAFADQTNEWKFIVPETASELLFNSVCLKK